MKYISQIRLINGNDVKLKAFSVVHFLKLINDEYEALNSSDLQDSYSKLGFYQDIVEYSLCTTLVFNMYSIFEILFDKKHNPLKRIRNKIGHGFQSDKYAFLNNNKTALNNNFLEYEFDEYKSANFTRGVNNKTLIISCWCFSDKCNSRFFETDNMTGDQFKVREMLIKSFTINNKPLYIDSVGNYVLNLDYYYELVCVEADKYLSSIHMI